MGRGISTMAATESAPSASFLRRYGIWAGLAVVLVLGAAVRSVGIGENPPGFFADEASAGYNAYTILRDGVDEHGESWPVHFEAFGEYKLPVYIYSLVPFIAALGLTEIAVRITSAAYGVLAIGAVFLLASTALKSRTAGLSAAFFLAVMPWHIHYSRTGLGELVTFVPLLAIALYLFIRGMRGNSGFLLVSAIAFGLTAYTYRAAWVVLPALLAIISVLYWRELWARKRQAGAGVAVFAAMSIPIMLHLVLNSGDRYVDVGISNLGLGAWETAKRFSEQYRSYFTLSFLFLEGDNQGWLRHYLPDAGLLHLVQLPVAALGLLGLVLRPTREKGLLLALVGLYPMAGALSADSPTSSRAILGTAAMAILSGYGTVLLAQSVVQIRMLRPLRLTPAPVAGIIVALALAGLGAYLYEYHNRYPEVAARYWGWQYGPREVIKYFESVESAYDQLVMEGDVNEPYIFLRFYAPEGCAKCALGDDSLYDASRRQLFALRPGHVDRARFEVAVKHIVEYPRGSRSFLLVELEQRSGAR